MKEKQKLGSVQLHSTWGTLNEVQYFPIIHVTLRITHHCIFSRFVKQKLQTRKHYRMSNLRWPGSRSRGRSRYFWITCTWPWLSMKSSSSAASEEMRMPSPNRAKANHNQSSSPQEEKLSAKPERKFWQQVKTDRRLLLAVSLFILHPFPPSISLTLPSPHKSTRVIQPSLHVGL